MFLGQGFRVLFFTAMQVQIWRVCVCEVPDHWEIVVLGARYDVFHGGWGLGGMEHVSSTFGLRFLEWRVPVMSLHGSYVRCFLYNESVCMYSYGVIDDMNVTRRGTFVWLSWIPR